MKVGPIDSHISSAYAKYTALPKIPQWQIKSHLGSSRRLQGRVCVSLRSVGLGPKTYHLWLSPVLPHNPDCVLRHTKGVLLGLMQIDCKGLNLRGVTQNHSHKLSNSRSMMAGVLLRRTKPSGILSACRAVVSYGDQGLEFGPIFQIRRISRHTSNWLLPYVAASGLMSVCCRVSRSGSMQLR